MHMNEYDRDLGLHLWEWATPWSAEEMLEGKRQRLDIPAHARTAQNGLLKKRREEDQPPNRWRNKIDFLGSIMKKIMS